jgi:hypothetical protein
MELKVITSSYPGGLNELVAREITNGFVPVGSHNVSSVRSVNQFRGDQLMATNHENEYSITMIKNSFNYNVVEIKTTAYDEENFILVTTLSDEQIQKVITPIVMDERDYQVEYDNEQLLQALRNTYPDASIEMITTLKVLEI